ncbi:MAG: hypothetical protein [Bacteriophage sp.]|nr:MAG: hypothetical protein [Bacteriophage sp.]
MNTYDVLYVDPPWKYNNKASNGAAENHYSTMSLEELKAMPVRELASKDAVLFMWWTPTHAADALELVKSWGFTFKNMNAFTWCKLNRNTMDRVSRRMWQFAKDLQDKADEADVRKPKIADFNLIAEDMLSMFINEAFMGMGNYTRGNAECVLVATRGKALDRFSKAEKQMIIKPLDDHSTKPEEVATRISRIYPYHRKIELFARRPRIGWHIFGDEPGVAFDVRYDGERFR